MELIQLLNKFQQNLNILTDINTTMGMVFVKQREFVQKLKGTHIITCITEGDLIDFVQNQVVAVAVSSKRWMSYSSGILRCGSSEKIDNIVLIVGYTPDYYIIKNLGGHLGE